MFEREENKREKKRKEKEKIMLLSGASSIAIMIITRKETQEKIELEEDYLMERKTGSLGGGQHGWILRGKEKNFGFFEVFLSEKWVIPESCFFPFCFSDQSEVRYSTT